MNTFLAFAGLLGSVLATPTPNNGNGAESVNGITFQPQDIIVRDVAILGGGSTGTYSAIRLSKDLGKTVIVVEKTGNLGGHTNTYIDPVTHYPVDYGVVAWHDIPTVTNFFARFNVSLSPVPNASPFATMYANLHTGQYLPNYVAPNAADLAQAIGIWYSICAKYQNLPYGYNLTYPVAQELLQPFSTTVTQYNLQALVPFIWDFSHAIGDMMKQSTLYVIQNFGLPQLSTGFLTTTNHFNSEIYIKAATVLGNDVLYNSVASKIFRDAGGHGPNKQLVIVQTPTGKKLIKAKKLLVTFAPTLDNLEPFSLEHAESKVFCQLISNPYYAGLIRNGINDGVSISNLDPSAPFSIPLAPFVQNVGFLGVPSLHHFYAEFTSPKTDQQVKDFVVSAIAPISNSSLPRPTIEIISNHSPTGLRFKPEAIQKKIYEDMYNLQGQKSTFYTGLAWAPDDSSLLWRYTDLTVLPPLVASLA